MGAARKILKSYNKPDWRQINYEFIHDQPYLWSGDKLQFRYAELSGDTGDLMFRDHLVNVLPSPDYYTAIDHDIVCLIKLMRDEKGIPFKMSFGDFQHCLFNIVNQSPTLGVIGLDTTYGTRPSWWKGQYDWFREIIPGIANRKCQKPCLILNHDLDRGGEPNTGPFERLRSQAECIANTFATWDHQRTIYKTLTTGLEDILKPGVCDRMVGGFHIYRSKRDDDTNGSQRNRMATVRLTFDTVHKTTTVYFYRR